MVGPAPSKGDNGDFLFPVASHLVRPTSPSLLRRAPSLVTERLLLVLHLPRLPCHRHRYNYGQLRHDTVYARVIGKLSERLFSFCQVSPHFVSFFPLFLSNVVLLRDIRVLVMTF